MTSMAEKRTACVTVEPLAHSHPKTGQSANGTESNGVPTSPVVAPRTSWRLGTDSPFSLVPAKPGEHLLARQLLTGTLRGPSHAEFQAQLDDPYAEPKDRLFCKLNGAAVGHVRLVRRNMHFGTAALPVTWVADLAVLPEFRSKGCGTALIEAAEEQMGRDGALLGITRTQQPQFFLQRGWCVWTRHSFSVASPREILSRLLERDAALPHGLTAKRHHYKIRWWRQIEQESVGDLYARHTQRSFGPLIRSEAYWQWLIGRHAFDRIYVAQEGPNETEPVTPIVGYAVVKDGRILELMSCPEHPEAAVELLARACADAIEQDTHYVRLDASFHDPLHQIVGDARGEVGYHESLHGEACLVKILHLDRLVDTLGEQLAERAREAGIATPTELGLHMEGARQTLELRARSARLRPGRSCRSSLECSRTVLTQLLLGHLDIKSAVSSGRVRASTRVAMELACVLFPKLPLWRPPWDEYPAS